MVANLTKTAFWDVDFEAIDFDKHSVYVIEKVFNYGLLQDQKAILAYYGRERVISDVLKAAYLEKKVLNFLCVIFNLQPEQFKCYKRTQLNPEHWSY